MTTDRIRRVSLKVAEMPLEKRIEILEAAGLASPAAIARARAKLAGSAKAKPAKKAKTRAVKKSMKAAGRRRAGQK
ncbi:hypothetical protein [Tautonia marina]|uniref:hypothetical protein n=1 Tax=Tautonia marina TaxID=2653855 RepID=UPI0012607F94|nr:hypothetical protein [Tautonia marina]